MDELLVDTCRSRMDALHAAAKKDCRCKGCWLTTGVAALLANRIDIKALCVDVYKALEAGRCESTPVVVFAGGRGGEGKSIFLKPLLGVFGDDFVFGRPEPGSFPLVDLPSKKVAFLDDWRFDDSVLSYATQCLWYDGSNVTVQRPQNDPALKGHVTYKGSAPIFATTKLPDLKNLEWNASIDPATGSAYDADASMVLRRLKVYEFTERIPKPKQQLVHCESCFANLVIGQAGAL